MQMINGDLIEPLGTINLNLYIGHQKVNHTFYVFEKVPFPMIIGRELIRKVHLIPDEKENCFWLHDKPELKYTLRTIRGKRTCFYLNASKVNALEVDVNERVEKLLENFPSVARKDEVIGRTHLVKHKIEVTSDKKINCSPIYFPPTYTKEISQQIEKMLKNGIIRETNESNYNANIVLAPKPNNKVRMAIGYKRLNAITKDNIYPMPKISFIMKRLPLGGYYSKIDCNSGFWQIAMDEESIKYTTFNFQGKLYQFLVMPFGLKNSPSTFVGLMNKVLNGIIGDYCYVYVDDVIVFSKTLDEHFEHLNQVFERLRDAGITISMEKSKFCLREMTFLGHLITQDGIKMVPEKVRAIKELPVPSCKEDLHTFVGMCAWYQCYIQDFSTIAGPLYRI